MNPDLGVLISVETNFLMSVAMGREERGDELLATVSEAVRVAIPSSCYMEAPSAFEDELKRRNRFLAEVGRLRRDVTSMNVQDLLKNLEPALIANALLLNDVQDRLYRFIDRASRVMESIPEPASVIWEAVNSSILPDPTDDLILHVILDHGRRFPEARKVTPTENSRDFDAGDVRGARERTGGKRSVPVGGRPAGMAGCRTRPDLICSESACPAGYAAR